MRERKIKFRNELKEALELEGRTKVLYKEDQGVLIGKIIYVKGELVMVLGIKYTRYGLDIFVVPVVDYCLYHTVDYDNPDITLENLDNYIKGVKQSLRLWKKRRRKRSYSKYNIHINYGVKGSNKNVRPELLSIDIDYSNDRLSEEFFISSMTTTFNTMRATGRYIKYDNYVLVNNTTKNVLVKNQDYKTITIRS